MKTFAEKNWGDCSKAVAYEFNFVQLCYMYDSDSYRNYFDLCHKCERPTRQNRDYEYPKSGFSKKDYFQLDTYESAVSEKLMNDLISFGISIENFRPIYTRKHDIVLGYQVVPIKILSSIFRQNDVKRRLVCKECNKFEYSVCETYITAYDRIGYPNYISKEVLNEINEYHISGLFEDKSGIMISLELYNYLIEKYPRLECRPVFLGDISDDPEYRRLNPRSYKARRKLLGLD